jgi:predicted nucleic acid-binding protein
VNAAADHTARRRQAGCLSNDSWIAATPLALDVPVVTQDDDFSDITRLDVIRV